MEILEQFSASLIAWAFIFLLVAVPATFIIGVWKRDDLDQTAKVMWMIFLIIAPIFSILIYLLFGYKRKSNY